MAELFKTFQSTASPWVPGPDRHQMLVDAQTNAPVGVRNLGTQGPDAIIAPIDVTAAQIASPPPAMLADLNSTFRLNVSPYTRYYSNGITLVQLGMGGGVGIYAPLASPVFTGNPTAPTPAPGDNDTSIATTAFVTTAVGAGGGANAPLASPVFTGDPRAPTPTAGDNDTSIATTAFVYAASAAAVSAAATAAAGLYVSTASPAFTGNPTAPTPAPGDNDASIATTAFVTAADTVSAAAAVATAATAAASIYAPLASPALTGNPTAPTPAPGDNDTSIATTAFVTAAIGSVGGGAAPLASPAFTGNPTAPTPTAGDNDTSLATTAFVTAADVVAVAAAATAAATLYAPKASPVLTGNPTAPTPTAGDNDTSIATTAFVTAAVALSAPLASPALTGNPTAPTPAPGDNDTSIATTAFVTAAVGVGGVGGAPIASPVFTGDPRAPTPTAGDNDTSIATTAFVVAAIGTVGGSIYAPLASPALTGNPTAPTQTAGNNTTRIATTAFATTADTAAVAAAVSSAATAAAALYLPGPVPTNLGTWLQAKVDAGQSADWLWGNFTITAPVTVNFNATLSGFRFDGHGAKFTAGFADTTNNLISFILPDAAPANTNIIAPQFANFSLDCGAQNRVKHGLYISCRLAQSFLFGVRITNLEVFGAHEDGIRLYGNVFEAYVTDCVCRDNGQGGANFRNPTAGGGTGIISSVYVKGGDYRTNRFGIMASADVTYQEPGGIYIMGVDFIANRSAGIVCFAGVKIVRDCHFENNCGSNGGETSGAIWNVFGPIVIDTCDATANNGLQLYLVDCLGQVSRNCHIRSSEWNNKLGKLAGNGTMYVDNSIAPTDFDATGWTINRDVVTATIIP